MPQTRDLLDTPNWESVAVPHARQREFTTRNGERYRLLIALPTQPPPPTGYPAIVLVDGQALFATAAIAAQLQAAREEATGVCPGVVIGVGYPGDAFFNADRRARDLLPIDDGADRFLETIVSEIWPAVERLAPLDPLRRTLVGHSYGGLFALHALFSRSDAFTSYVAGSPSIWWNDRAILRAEEAFRGALNERKRRLLISVGGLEQRSDLAPNSSRASRVATARMVDNASEMAERLLRSDRVDCEFTLFPNENHASVIPSMLSRAVAFALSRASHNMTAAA